MDTWSTGRRCRPASATRIFSGLLLVETLLVLVLAPAFTTGAISLEREKQTLDLLVATPLSTLGMVHRQAALGARPRCSC